MKSTIVKIRLEFGRCVVNFSFFKFRLPIVDVSVRSSSRSVSFRVEFAATLKPDLAALFVYFFSGVIRFLGVVGGKTSDGVLIPQLNRHFLNAQIKMNTACTLYFLFIIIIIANSKSK